MPDPVHSQQPRHPHVPWVPLCLFKFMSLGKEQLLNELFIVDGKGWPPRLPFRT